MKSPAQSSRFVKSSEKNLSNVNIPSDPESIDEFVEVNMSPEQKLKMIAENTWPKQRKQSDSDIDEEDDPNERFRAKDPEDIDADVGDDVEVV